MAQSAKHRAATTNSGRARNDETTTPKRTSDSQRGMASKGRDGKAKRSPGTSSGSKG
jgi:hypothetical protein